MRIFYAYEDLPLQAVAIKLITQEKIGCELTKIGDNYGGRDWILKQEQREAYNQMSKRFPVILFIDLDAEACAPSLLAKYPIRDRQPAQRFQIRIAVREVESWLLADRQGFAKYFGISQGAIPSNPESLPDPKRTLLKLIKEKAREEFKRRMLPTGGATTGAGYNEYITDFINTEWNSTRACANANSLTRAINGIRQITP